MKINSIQRVLTFEDINVTNNLGLGIIELGLNDVNEWFQLKDRYLW